MHVDCDPDSNPDSGPGAHVNTAYGPARLHKDSDSDLDADWLCLHVWRQTGFKSMHILYSNHLWIVIQIRIRIRDLVLV